MWESHAVLLAMGLRFCCLRLTVNKVFFCLPQFLGRAFPLLLLRFEIESQLSDGGSVGLGVTDSPGFLTSSDLFLSNPLVPPGGTFAVLAT